MTPQKKIRFCLPLLLIIMLLAGCSTPASVVPEPAATTAPEDPVATQVMTEVPTEIVENTPEAASPAMQITDIGPLQFNPGSTSMHSPGDLDPNTGLRFTVSAMKGQQMTIWLSTEPASTDIPLATLYIMDASGAVLTPAPVTYWSQVLPADQTYTVEIQSLAQQSINYSMEIEIPAETVDPAFGDMYQPLDLSVCQMIQEQAEIALARDFYLRERAPFMDVAGQEAGQGCSLIAGGTGADFSDPGSVVNSLINTLGQGWTVNQNYYADGVTGSAAGLYRDMGLILINVTWKPIMGVVCPSDQPLDACGLTPDQKDYTVKIDLAQYRADFSMDGHWVDASTGFTLDLYQDWKQIYGQHEVVAQNGNKIDSLEASINGWLKGKVTTVLFQSSFTDQPGTAEITYIDVNTIQWKITAAPAGEYYLPAEATLTRTAQ